MTTYLLAGGGTAGHVNPLLATADAIRQREPESTVLVLGTREGLESRLVPARGYRLLTIARLPFPRRPGRAALTFPNRFRQAVVQTERYLLDHRVDVVVGFGGYASAPAYRAARRLRVPFVIHEANAKPGIANRWGARSTPFVGVAFRQTRLPHATWVGMPLRREIEELDRHAARAEAARLFGLDPAKPTLLVTGGSTGARSINATVSEAVAHIIGAGWQVLHIAGAKNELVDPGLADYHLLNYCDRMELAIAVADLAVARSGSGTVSELAAVGVPAVFVPYPVGNGEQRFNAADAVAAGGAILVADAEFTPGWVRTTLVPLLRNPAAVADLAQRILSVGTRDGASRMVDLVERARR
ncbi:glycosyltransferase [Galbitalea soli]|uniref:UDP-N-acetylglucosamine--N-acetylmuramyl-(pentapeptide) pyrophosphoryl-undecaprenol N-acetylglucosamine transferase n=1 Tax=Galbitalea soli TaxID=1268042 RepID=A0A7C9PL53_9MICO|nr:UDP-N-acetylglucosamine--N-acetylmuramyl-(pentapeptide) pyrophosphoryl-undecaprenol N-acetylglucosamine transferase [Galbitalea soli]NYJ30719.1 UDP-N-acetylglucosamine--N-acetylmuramyl-(pentapeptide) pyrophosphoryl-undecaprenol N-acetylglucosamine transferase [Galbitalea soli]